MTREQKDLLIKDLCGRLSHGVKCKILETNEVKILGSIQYDGENTLFDFWEDDQKIQYGYQLYLSEFKPCLLPLSSMLEEQFEELKSFTDLTYEGNTLELVEWNDNCKTLEFWLEEIPSHCVIKVFDWLNKNHFDYRGLIPMGLGINASDKNIY